MQNTVIPAIQAVAQQAGVPLIDNNTPLLNQPGLFSGGVHPTTQGAGILANNVGAAIAP
jgi:lysophospholipase L1-like esterase